jgi:hypothetical protein
MDAMNDPETIGVGEGRKHRPKIKTLAALAAGVALLLAGCGGGATTTTNSAAASDTGTTATAPVSEVVTTAARAEGTSVVTSPTATEATSAAATETATTATTAIPSATTVTTSARATSARQAATASTTALAGGGSADLGGDYEQMAQKVAQAQLAAKSWRQTMVITTKAGQHQEVTYEFVRPDRLHVKSNRGGGGSSEQIYIGADTYTNRGAGWEKSTGGGTGQAIFAVVGFNGSAKPGTPEYDDQQKALKDAGVTATKGGRSTRNGVACQEWNSVTTTPPATGALCIGLSDNLPVEIKSTSGDGATVTITFSDWNAPITINPPI